MIPVLSKNISDVVLIDWAQNDPSYEFIKSVPGEESSVGPRYENEVVNGKIYKRT